MSFKDVYYLWLRLCKLNNLVGVFTKDLLLGYIYPQLQLFLFGSGSYCIQFITVFSLNIKDSDIVIYVVNN